MLLDRPDDGRARLVSWDEVKKSLIDLFCEEEGGADDEGSGEEESIRIGCEEEAMERFRLEEVEREVESEMEGGTGRSLLLEWVVFMYRRAPGKAAGST
jgi:hypothetical protein